MPIRISIRDTGLIGRNLLKQQRLWRIVREP